MPNDMTLFLILVFVTVVLLSCALVVAVFGADATSVRRTRARIRAALPSSMSEQTQTQQSLLHERYLRQLTPLEQSLEQLPLMADLEKLLQQVGRNTPGYRFVLFSCAVALAVSAVALLLSFNWFAVLLGAIGAGFLPLILLLRKRAQRLAAFEEQLPEALSMMSRALRAGLPFPEALKIAGSEMPEPIGSELTETFFDINYGMGIGDGFINLLTRVPSMSLTTVVTAVLVQRDTGGNLAEIMDKIGQVVRSRFKFQRRIRSLSAEGRLSAWVLALVPLGLGVVLSVTQPDYLPKLLDDPLGQRLIQFAVAGLVIGALWIRKIIQIRV